MPKLQLLKEFNSTILAGRSSVKGYYRLEGDVTDSSAAGNNGSNSGVTFSTGDGYFGQGGNFSAAPKYFAAMASSVFDLAGGGSMCFGALFKTTMTTTGFLITMQPSSGNAQLALSIGNVAAGRVRFSVRDNTDGSTDEIDSTMTLHDGDWHSAIGVKRGAVLELWIDGEINNYKTTAENGAYTFNATTVKVGADRDGGNNFVGSMDEVFMMTSAPHPFEIENVLCGIKTIGEGWPMANLVGHYKLNGNSYDYTGTGYNGSDTSVSYVDGKIKKAGSFVSASSSRVFVTSPANFVFTGDFVINVWAKPSSSQGDAYARILDMGYYLMVITDGGVYNNGWAFENVQTIGLTNTVDFNTWQMITVTRSGSTLSLYKNAKFLVEGSFPGTKGSGNFFFCSQGGSGRFYDGLVDECTIWNGINWTAADVMKYYRWSLSRNPRIT